MKPTTIYAADSDGIPMNDDPLEALDEPAASLRILYTVGREGHGVNITSLHDTMKRMGIGRTAVDSSRMALLKAGLLSEERVRAEGRRRFTVLRLTEMGVRVVTKIKDIEEIMRASQLTGE